MPRSPARQPVKGGHLFVGSHFAALDFALSFLKLSPLLFRRRPKILVEPCPHLFFRDELTTIGFVKAALDAAPLIFREHMGRGAHRLDSEQRLRGFFLHRARPAKDTLKQSLNFHLRHVAYIARRRHAVTHNGVAAVIFTSSTNRHLFARAARSCPTADVPQTLESNPE